MFNENDINKNRLIWKVFDLIICTQYSFIYVYVNFSNIEIPG